MYFNDVFIGYYVLIVFVGFLVGKIVAWCNVRMPEKKTIFSKDFFEENKKGLKLNYFFMISTAIIYALLLYKYGINREDFFANLELIKFLILVPMLLLVFFIDVKHRIIPNRLNLTIFEIGLVITFIYGISYVNKARDYILGMLLGAGIFLAITALGKIISGKESMGFGDVKFMGAVGLFYGINGILDISLGAFFFGAIASIFILIYRFVIIKSKDEYISFGPFLSTTALACMFLGSGTILNVFMDFCRLISYHL
ncbi:MAG: A24 family peptidase [Clostridia bacterium]|nr:A24 family peptidase [Clostridia bacterium]